MHYIQLYTETGYFIEMNRIPERMESLPIQIKDKIKNSQYFCFYVGLRMDNPIGYILSGQIYNLEDFILKESFPFTGWAFEVLEKK